MKKIAATALSVFVCATLSICGLSACGGTTKGPTNVLDHYSLALKAKKYDQAYALMSEQFRARHSKEEFVRMMKENAREVGETANRLKAAHKAFKVTAEFRYGLGDTMRLVRQNGQWRIASNPIHFYSHASPREALRSFIRAYNLKRWDVMLMFVPDKYRKRMNIDKVKKQFHGDDREAMASMMNMLEANIDEPIQDKGNEARMPYGEKYEVTFLREDGKWKIQDLD